SRTPARHRRALPARAIGSHRGGDGEASAWRSTARRAATALRGGPPRQATHRAARAVPVKNPRISSARHDSTVELSPASGVERRVRDAAATALVERAAGGSPRPSRSDLDPRLRGPRGSAWLPPAFGRREESTFRCRVTSPPRSPATATAPPAGAARDPLDRTGGGAHKIAHAARGEADRRDRRSERDRGRDRPGLCARGRARRVARRRGRARTAGRGRGGAVRRLPPLRRLPAGRRLRRLRPRRRGARRDRRARERRGGRRPQGRRAHHRARARADVPGERLRDGLHEPGGLPAHEGARRPHHQLRLGRGHPRAARLRALLRDEGRGHVLDAHGRAGVGAVRHHRELRRPRDLDAHVRQLPPPPLGAGARDPRHGDGARDPARRTARRPRSRHGARDDLPRERRPAVHHGPDLSRGRRHGDAELMQIIDGDGHTVEPPDLWVERMDQRRWGDWIPRSFHDDGLETWYVGGVCRAGSKPVLEEVASQYGMTAQQLEALLDSIRRPGGYDPAARLADMDLEGMDAAVVYPTRALFFGPLDPIPALHDVAFVADCLRAYNDWAAEFCSAAPKRLFAIAGVPLQDVELAVREAERAVGLGLRGVFLRPSPYVDERPLSDPVYDRFWAACQDLDVPVAFHPGVHVDTPGACRKFGLVHEHANMTITNMLVDAQHGGSAFGQAIGNTCDMMVTVGRLLMGGVCERFPRLRFLFLESGGGWIGTLLQRM